jgi:hypothetical protein
LGASLQVTEDAPGGDAALGVDLLWTHHPPIGAHLQHLDEPLGDGLDELGVGVEQEEVVLDEMAVGEVARQVGALPVPGVPSVAADHGVHVVACPGEHLLVLNVHSGAAVLPDGPLHARLVLDGTEEELLQEVRGRPVDDQPSDHATHRHRPPLRIKSTRSRVPCSQAHFTMNDTYDSRSLVARRLIPSTCLA